MLFVFFSHYRCFLLNWLCVEFAKSFINILLRLSWFVNSRKRIVKNFILLQVDLFLRLHNFFKQILLSFNYLLLLDGFRLFFSNWLWFTGFNLNFLFYLFHRLLDVWLRHNQISERVLFNDRLFHLFLRNLNWLFYFELFFFNFSRLLIEVSKFFFWLSRLLSFTFKRTEVFHIIHLLITLIECVKILLEILFWFLLFSCFNNIHNDRCGLTDWLILLNTHLDALKSSEKVLLRRLVVVNYFHWLLSY